MNRERTFERHEEEIGEGCLMSAEGRGRTSYLDLLITTLMEHEKNLDRLVERLEKTCEDLSATSSRLARKPQRPLPERKMVEPTHPTQTRLSI